MNVLVSDASIPFASTLASALRGAGMGVALLSPVGSDAVSLAGDIPLIAWNRPSRLSARTVQVSMKNIASSLDCAVVFFDAHAFSLATAGPDSVSGPIEQYVTGFLLLIDELRAFFSKQGSGRLIFVLKDDRPGADAATGGVSPRNLPVAVAESAFVRLAEEMSSASINGVLPGLQVSLVKFDASDPAATSDWFSAFVSSPAGSKGPVRWIRAGSRGLFGKF